MPAPNAEVASALKSNITLLTQPVMEGGFSAVMPSPIPPDARVWTNLEVMRQDFEAIQRATNAAVHVYVQVPGETTCTCITVDTIACPA